MRSIVCELYLDGKMVSQTKNPTILWTKSRGSRNKQGQANKIRKATQIRGWEHSVVVLLPAAARKVERGGKGISESQRRVGRWRGAGPCGSPEERGLSVISVAEMEVFKETPTFLHLRTRVLKQRIYKMGISSGKEDGWERAD